MPSDDFCHGRCLGSSRLQSIAQNLDHLWNISSSIIFTFDILQVCRFTLTRGKVELSVISWGATITALKYQHIDIISITTTTITKTIITSQNLNIMTLSPQSGWRRHSAWLWGYGWVGDIIFIQYHNCPTQICQQEDNCMIINLEGTPLRRVEERTHTLELLSAGCRNPALYIILLNLFFEHCSQGGQLNIKKY